MNCGEAVDRRGRPVYSCSNSLVKAAISALLQLLESAPWPILKSVCLKHYISALTVTEIFCQKLMAIVAVFAAVCISAKGRF